MGTQTGSDVAEAADQETGTRETERGGVDRRGALRGVAVAGVLGVSGAALAACSSNSSSNAGSSNGGDSTTTSSSGGGSSASSGSGSGGSELTTTSQVPEGGGIILKDVKVVITQPSAGDYKGFSATCTHAGCTVAQISGGVIQCPCHGSEYSIKDGSVVRGPAPNPLPPVSITVKNGEIFSA